MNNIYLNNYPINKNRSVQILRKKEKKEKNKKRN